MLDLVEIRKRTTKVFRTTIGGYTLRVNLVPGLHSRNSVMGLYHPETPEISIDANLSPNDFLITLFHELNHAIAEILQIEETEVETDLRAQFMLQALRPILSLKVKRPAPPKRRR